MANNFLGIMYMFKGLTRKGHIKAFVVQGNIHAIINTKIAITPAIPVDLRRRFNIEAYLLAFQSYRPEKICPISFTTS